MIFPTKLKTIYTFCTCFPSTFSGFNLRNHAIKIWSVKRHTRYIVVNKGNGIGKVRSSCNKRPANSSADPIIANLFLFVIGRFYGFRFYEPYHLVAELFRAAAGGRHFIVSAADFVADGFFCFPCFLLRRSRGNASPIFKKSIL